MWNIAIIYTSHLFVWAYTSSRFELVNSNLEIAYFYVYMVYSKRRNGVILEIPNDYLNLEDQSFMFFLTSLPRSHMSSAKYCNFNFTLLVDQFCNFSTWRIVLTLIGISVPQPSYYTLVQHGRALVVMKI